VICYIHGKLACVDKNSLWNGLNIEKRELYVKKKKIHKIWGNFLKPSWGNQDKELLE